MHVICPHLAVQGLHLFFQHNRPKVDLRGYGISCLYFFTFYLAVIAAWTHTFSS